MLKKEHANIIGDSSFWKKYPERDIEFVRWYPCNLGALTGREIFAKHESEQDTELSFYVHIPFCNNVCICCPYNKQGTRSQTVSDYLEALKKEIRNYAKQDYIKNAKFVSGYFGGGTPTTLSAEQLDDLLSCMYTELNIDENVSVTMETTPNDITEEKIEVLKKYNVNRVSVGVQTLDDTLLKRIGRSHNAKEAIDCIKMLKDNGIKHIGADLMWGIPGQTMKQWEKSLKGMIDLGLVDSYSLYQYTVLPSSPLYMRMESGQIPNCPDEKVQQDMYWNSVKLLHKAGFVSVSNIDFVSESILRDEQAESFSISNADGKGLVGKSCDAVRHIANTWYEGKPMLAVGSGAYGYLNHSTYLNEADVKEYIRKVNDEGDSVVMGKYVSEEERMRRSMVLGIRLLRFYRDDFRRMHGVDMTDVFQDEINRLTEWGLVTLTDEYIEVTYPKGWYYMENVSKMFYSEDNYRLPQPNAAGAMLVNLLK